MLELISFITLALVIASLGFSIYSFAASKKTRVLSDIELRKEDAKLWFLLLRHYVQDHRDTLTKATTSADREQTITNFRMSLPLSTISRRLYSIYTLYPIVPKSLMDMIFEEDFFGNESKLDKFIAEIGKIIAELS